MTKQRDISYKTLICRVCGWLYSESAGAPAEGIAAGTRWVDVPDDWRCPDCGVSKSEFDMIELKN